MSSPLEQWFVQRLLGAVGNPRIGFELWDGRDVSMVAGAAGESPVAVLRLHDREALFKLLYKPTRSFGELYTSGRITVTGDLEAALYEIYGGIRRHRSSRGRGLRLLDEVRSRRWPGNSPGRARKNIHAHYDLGNPFYELWLDTQYNQYTCAYYPSADATLEDAQAAKLDLICRKLALNSSDTVVEAGSGWGGLARYLARHHGVKVLSCNISREQVVYARERAAREGFGNRIEYVEDDYRNLSGSYDVFVSVGMLEHVGLAGYGELGRVIDRCLKKDGRGLIHSIGRSQPKPLNEWIATYIFPGAYPPVLREMMRIFEAADLTVVDVENLRAHYVRTLQHWRERFESSSEEVARMFDASFVRAWRLYLAGSQTAFRTGDLQLFQVLFERTGGGRLPETRARLFETAAADPGVFDG
ncbi:MAG: cyclopropane-fatty-acyl-phospholipid synthase family protein [Pseudomonadales bacterium]